MGPPTPPPDRPDQGVCSTVAAIRFLAPDGAANRAAASKAACLLRHWRRCAAFPYSGLHSRGTGGRWSMGQLPLTTHGAAAKREAEPIRFAPRMSSGVSSRADHLRFLQTLARAQRGDRTANIRRPPAKTPVFARTCRQAGFGHQAAFSSTVHGAFFFAKTKKNGGCKLPSASLR